MLPNNYCFSVNITRVRRTVLGDRDSKNGGRGSPRETWYKIECGVEYLTGIWYIWEHLSEYGPARPVDGAELRDHNVIHYYTLVVICGVGSASALVLRFDGCDQVNQWLSPPPQLADSDCHHLLNQIDCSNGVP